MSVSHDNTPPRSGSGATPTIADPDFDEALEGPRAPRRGDTLGRYVLLERLGEGGMGLVYAAYDPDLDRRIAIKILRGPSVSFDEDSRARLLREAQAMARLSHPNVMTVHEVGTAQGRPFIAMELVAGQDLRTWFRARTRSWKEVLEVMLGAGRGLAAAHRAGLIHRDFKPANVLVGDDGLVRVLDFGLARQVGTSAALEPDDETLLRSGVSGSDSRLDTPLTRAGTVPGTPAYMAPEQHLRGELDEQTDQFAFCVTAYEGFFGRRPFEGGNRASLMMAVTQGQIVAPPRSTPVPRRLIRAIYKGLSSNPADRFPDMHALLDEMEAAGRPRRLTMPALGSSLVVLGGAAWWLSADAPADPCPRPDAALAEAWGRDQREAVRAAFSKAELPHAERSASAVIERLDHYAEHWIEASIESCRATRIEHRQSRTMHEVVVRCLERSRRDLKHVADVLADAPGTHGLLDDATKISGALPPIDACDPAALADDPLPSPDDPDAVEAIRDELSRVRALWAAARYEEGLPIAARAVDRARDSGYPPIVAEALLEHGTTLIQAGERREGLDVLHRAALAATAAGHTKAQFEAWLELARQEASSKAPPKKR